MSGDLDLDVADPELIDEQEEELKKDEPKMFKVVFLNDDFTPMEFVIEMLQKHHNLDFDKATTVMLNVHEKGKGIAGVYTYQIAETKCVMVEMEANLNDYPLKNVMEED